MYICSLAIFPVCLMDHGWSPLVTTYTLMSWTLTLIKQVIFSIDQGRHSKESEFEG